MLIGHLKQRTAVAKRLAADDADKKQREMLAEYEAWANMKLEDLAIRAKAAAERCENQVLVMTLEEGLDLESLEDSSELCPELLRGRAKLLYLKIEHDRLLLPVEERFDIVLRTFRPIDKERNRFDSTRYMSMLLSW